MNTKCVINVDLADVWGDPGRKNYLRTLAWGDEVTVTKQTSTAIEIETVYFNQQPDGSIAVPAALRSYMGGVERIARD